MEADSSEVKMLKFLLWLLLLVLSWPLALVALVAWPLVWLLSLPFRLVGISVTAVFELLGAAISLRYAGLYPQNVRKVVAIEGMGRPPAMEKESAGLTEQKRLQRWVDRLRDLSGRMPRRYKSLEEAWARMQAGMDDFMSRVEATAAFPPGAAVIMVTGDGRRYVRVHGELKAGSGNAATEESAFYIASMTKAYAGLLAVRLDAEGLLPLRTTLADVWPDVRLPARGRQPEAISMRIVALNWMKKWLSWDGILWRGSANAR